MTAERAHVLLVEDDANTSGALRLLFEETGRRVTLAGSVEAAVAAALADRPALVLLDLTLPDGSGLEVLERLRAAGTTLPLTVALTGHDDEGTRDRCLRAGCAEVLLKPVPIRELLRKTGEWLAGEEAVSP